MPTTTTRKRHPARRAAAGLVVVSALLLAAPAHAASYRYWTYWQGGHGSWAFATAGPAALIPADGSVEGWRFAVTTQAGSAGDAPRTTPSFADVCGQAPAAAQGSKRVALVVDPGPSADAPQGQTPPAGITTCVEVAADATGYQVLRAAAVVRTEGGLVCGIAGYPSGECAPVVEDLPAVPTADPGAGPSADPAPSGSAMAPAAAPAPSDPGTPWPTIAVLALAAAAGGLLLWRRRRA